MQIELAATIKGSKYYRSFFVEYLTKTEVKIFQQVEWDPFFDNCSYILMTRPDYFFSFDVTRYQTFDIRDYFWNV